MAKKIRVRLVLLGIGIFVLSARLSSVAAGQQAADPSTFTERLIEMNRAEIQFSGIAMSKARDKSVADFAETVVRAHGVSLHKLKGNEATEKYDLTPEHQQILDALNGAEDSKFDLQFMAMMVHEQ